MHNITTQKSLNIICISLLLSANCLKSAELNSQAIPRYIDHVVDQLTGVNNHYDLCAQSDINLIKDQAVKASQKPTFFEKLFYLDVERTQEQVQNNIFSSIIDFVEKQSYSYALNRTENYAHAHKIAKRIRNSVEKLLTQTGELTPGILSGFIGSELLQKVVEQVNLLDTIDNAAGTPAAGNSQFAGAVAGETASAGASTHLEG